MHTVIKHCLALLITLSSSALAADAQSWQVVGSRGISPDKAEFNSLAIGPSGIPYVAFENEGAGSVGASVMKFVDTAWQFAGTDTVTTNVANYTQLAFSHASGLCIFRMHFQPLTGVRFHLAMPLQIGEGGIHVIVGLARQQFQRVSLRSLAPARFRGRSEGRERILTCGGQRFRIKLDLA